MVKMSLKDEAYLLLNVAEVLGHKLPEHLYDDFWTNVVKGIENLIDELED